MASSAVGNNAFLKANPAELKEKANQINHLVQTMQTLMNNMNTSFGTVSENWQSDSGDRFREMAEKLLAEIRESLTNLLYYVSDLIEASEKYEQLESDIKGKVDSLEDPSSIFNV